MHFEILKMIATSGFLTALECTKSFSAGALPRTPLGSLQCSPRPPSWIKGALLLRGRVGRGEERKGREGTVGEEKGREGRGGNGRERRGGEGEGRRRGREKKGPPPPSEILGSAPATEY